MMGQCQKADLVHKKRLKLVRAKSNVGKVLTQRLHALLALELAMPLRIGRVGLWLDHEHTARPKPVKAAAKKALQAVITVMQMNPSVAAETETLEQRGGTWDSLTWSLTSTRYNREMRPAAPRHQRLHPPVTEGENNVCDPTTEAAYHGKMYRRESLFRRSSARVQLDHLRLC